MVIHVILRYPLYFIMVVNNYQGIIVDRSLYKLINVCIYLCVNSHLCIGGLILFMEYSEKQGAASVRMAMKPGHNLPFDLYVLIID
jgi:hypothetical protein